MVGAGQDVGDPLDGGVWQDRLQERQLAAAGVAVVAGDVQDGAVALGDQPGAVAGRAPSRPGIRPRRGCGPALGLGPRSRGRPGGRRPAPRCSARLVNASATNSGSASSMKPRSWLVSCPYRFGKRASAAGVRQYHRRGRPGPWRSSRWATRPASSSGAELLADRADGDARDLRPARSAVASPRALSRAQHRPAAGGHPGQGDVLAGVLGGGQLHRLGRTTGGHGSTRWLSPNSCHR